VDFRERSAEGDIPPNRTVRTEPLERSAGSSSSKRTEDRLLSVSIASSVVGPSRGQLEASEIVSDNANRTEEVVKDAVEEADDTEILLMVSNAPPVRTGSGEVGSETRRIRNVPRSSLSRL
jgi:hypothetical protein